MMPDLGKYAAEVYSAYAVSLSLILILLLVSIRQSRRTKAALREVEDARQAKMTARTAQGAAENG